jgi:hypothetical protein
MHFLDSRSSEVLARFRVVFEIVDGVIKRDVRSLHEGIDFSAGFEPKHAPDLRAAQDTRAVAFDRERLEGVPGQITPLLCEIVLDILRQFDFHRHAGSPELTRLPASSTLALTSALTSNIQERLFWVNMSGGWSVRAETRRKKLRAQHASPRVAPSKSSRKVSGFRSIQRLRSLAADCAFQTDAYCPPNFAIQLGSAKAVKLCARQTKSLVLKIKPLVLKIGGQTERYPASQKTIRASIRSAREG